MANTKIVDGVSVEMSEEEETAFLADQAAQQPTLAQRSAAAVLQIDVDVDALYQAVLGNRAAEYERAEREAIAFAAAEYPNNAIPGSVLGWATAKSWTPQAAADDIIATAAGWRTAQEQIRGQRLLRKEQARTAADVDALSTVMQGWRAYLGAARQALGVA